MKECKNCKDIISEVEELREELCKTRDAYTRICEKLWIISHTKRNKG